MAEAQIVCCHQASVQVLTVLSLVGTTTKACHHVTMTTYRRRGHYRRGPNGQRVWVSAHNVTRASGGSYISAQRRPVRVEASSLTPKEVRIPVRPRLVRSIHWAQPNATCPVCGQLVYFYANASGSRVFFDEIGPPWPKHPCTDNPASEVSHRQKKPVIYRAAVGRRKMAQELRSHPTSVTTLATSGHVDAFLVVHTRQDKRGTLIELWPLYEKATPEGWRTPALVSLEAGQLVFMRGQLLSYVDLTRMEISEIPVTFQYRSPRMTMRQRLQIASNR